MKLEELKKICDGLMPLPWLRDNKHIVSSWEDPIAETAHVKDAQFIVAAREYMPKLIKVAEAAKEYLKPVYINSCEDEERVEDLHFELVKALAELEKDE